MNPDRVSILLKKAALATERTAHPILARYDLTMSQYKILKYLYSQPPGSVKLIDLERVYAMTHPAAIDVLKVLEKKGYTTRVANPADRRSRIVTLTEKALALQDELEALGGQIEDAVTAGLTAGERVQLTALLQKLLDGQR